MGAAVDGAGGGPVVDDGDDVEGDGAHVEEHAGDVEERGEEEDALTPDQNREDVPSQALDEGGPSRRVEATAGLRPPVAKPRRPQRRLRRRRGAVPAARQPVVRVHLL